MDDLRELAERHNASENISVSLWWDPMFNHTFIRMQGAGFQGFDEFMVAAEDALDAFYHPYSYMPKENYYSVKV